jgi:hypothetical protein
MPNLPVMIGTVLVLAAIATLIWLISNALRAFAGTACPEEGCQGTMKPNTIPYGYDRRTTECLTCNRCGYTESILDPSPPV